MQDRAIGVGDNKKRTDGGIVALGKRSGKRQTTTRKYIISNKAECLGSSDYSDS